MRNLNLDLIRVIAMCGVLLDHYMWVFNSNVMSNIGLQMGGGKCGDVFRYFFTVVWN